jgi:hypothetical protein
MSVYDTKDPDEIIEHSVYEILDRLVFDANNLYALSEIDKAVLRKLADPSKSVKSEQEERLAEALRCIENVADNAAQARHSLTKYKKKIVSVQ